MQSQTSDVTILSLCASMLPWLLARRIAHNRADCMIVLPDSTSMLFANPHEGSGDEMSK